MRRILAKDYEVSGNTHQTKLNNNDLIVGTSGAGKTTGYVIPNIERCDGSMIVTDTKGNLERKLRPKLEAAGYQVMLLDLVDMKNSITYNPLAFIRKDEDGHASQRDILSIANTLMLKLYDRDPFWPESAKAVLACLISYVMETQPVEEQNLCSVIEMYTLAAQQQDLFEMLMLERFLQDRESFAVREFQTFGQTATSEKTYASIMAFVAKAIEAFNSRDVRRVVTGEQKFRFADMGRRKIALFVNVSDTDRTFDDLLSIFYEQALQQLVKEADSNEDSRLKVPVCMYMDDFATNCIVKDFDKIVSVIRSREISVSVILQSLTQLDSLYGGFAADTIVNQFDHLLYLGGQDERTIRHIARLANKPEDTVLHMQLDEVYVYERGRGAKLMKRYDPFSMASSDQKGEETVQESAYRSEQYTNSGKREKTAGDGFGAQSEDFL